MPSLRSSSVANSRLMSLSSTSSRRAPASRPLVARSGVAGAGRLSSAAENAPAPQHREDGVEQRRGRHRLDQEAIHARLLGQTDHVLAAVGGDHHHLGLARDGRHRDGCAGSPRRRSCRACASPSAPGRRALAAASSAASAAGPLARGADIEMEEAQHLGQDLARDLVVVHHQHADALEQRAGLLHQFAPVGLRLPGRSAAAP